MSSVSPSRELSNLRVVLGTPQSCSWYQVREVFCRFCNLANSRYTFNFFFLSYPTNLSHQKILPLSLQKRGKIKPLLLCNIFFCYFNSSLTDTTFLPLPPLKSNLKTPSRDPFKISDHSVTKTPLTASQRENTWQSPYNGQ